MMKHRSISAVEVALFACIYALGITGIFFKLSIIGSNLARFIGIPSAIGLVGLSIVSLSQLRQGKSERNGTI